MNFEFAHFYFLLLLPLLLIPFFRRKRNKDRPAVRHSLGNALAAIPANWRVRVFPYLDWLKWAALALMITAMARPRIKNVTEKITTEGIDIILALDISRSMLIEDMSKQSRLETSKQVAEQFVSNRKSDRIGLVLFAGKSFTQCPLTSDYPMVIRFIRQSQTGMIEDGTAIGMGIVNAVNRLRNSDTKSKVIILLTDGQNNRGEIDPITAAQIAQALGIRIYTIGAGKDGIARIPVDDPFFGRQYVPAEVKIDEPTLKSIANITGGQFFRATTREMLEQVYEDIDRLEKTKIEVTSYLRYGELYPWFLFPALTLLALYGIISKTMFHHIP